MEVVSNDPYFDLFWVPDRNKSVGMDALDGVGVWSLEAVVTDIANVSRKSIPKKIRVDPGLPPNVSLVTPEDGATFVFDMGNSISLVADAFDEDGLVREVQFLVNNLTTDFNGTASFLAQREPYILNWRPEKTRVYRIKSQAIENSGLSTISKEHIITVKDAEGEKPFAVWRGPEEVKDRADTYYSYYYYYYGFGSDSKNYLSNDVEWGSLVNLNVEAFDPSFTDNYGQAVEGGIQKLLFGKITPLSVNPPS